MSLTRERDLRLIAPTVLLVVGFVAAFLWVGNGPDDAGRSQSSDDSTAVAPADGGLRTEAAIDVPDVRFVDAAPEAGIRHRQQRLNRPPDCLFHDAVDRPLPEGAWSQAMSYVDCYEERFTGGVAVGDADGDAVDDLYVTRLDRPGILYLNRGDGTFVDWTEEAGLDQFDIHANGAAFADIDNDGDADLYVTTLRSPRFYLFVNDGSGQFTEEAVIRGADLGDEQPRAGFSVAVGDYDLDGFVDLHTTEWLAPLRQGDEPSTHARLLRNRGDDRAGFFEDVTEAAGVELDREPAWMPLFMRQGGRHPSFSFSSAFVDLDQDDLPDLAVSSDFTTSQLFWNNGDGTFTEGTRDARVDTVRFGMGSTFGDYDADGDLDWYVSSIMNPETSCLGRPCESPYNGNRLYRNDGERVFADVTDEAGVRNGFWGWGTAFADIDNDGLLDLASATGQDFGDEDAQLVRFHDTPMRLWHNLGEDGFVDIAAEVGMESAREGKGLAVLDYDRDGDLDFYVANNGARPALFRNDGGDQGHWLRVRAQGSTSNRDGFGVVVEVRATPGGAVQRREIGVASHFLGQSERVAHFGLGEVEQVAEVVVRFPATGRTVTRTDVPADQMLTIVEPDG